MWGIGYYLGLRIDTSEHLGGRFVRRVLRHKFALHREVENLRFSFGYGIYEFVRVIV